MKILAICSAIDLKFRYGCTPAWWQLFKGLYECRVDLIVVPYRGRAIESPWWRTYENPCYIEGEVFDKARRLVRRSTSARVKPTGDTWTDAIVQRLANGWVRPRWKKHLLRIFEREQGIDAVVVFTVPLNHIQGLPSELREQFQVPVFYYDGDVPASLPRFGGFASGFRIYQRADLSEYDGFICNSKGGAEELERMGARKTYVLYWAADPDLFAPMETEQDRDVFFYGFGSEFREDWLHKMIVQPSKELPDRDFVLGGCGFDGLDLGRARVIGDVPFNLYRSACARSKINLNITRQAHASVYASSSARPFELAAMGCCIVSNPVEGLEEWFDPGKEVFVVDDAQDVVELYRWLLTHDEERRRVGERARERVLREHTYSHRAQQLCQMIQEAKGGPMSSRHATENTVAGSRRLFGHGMCS
jgi:glycosyltransferase involved in cell wall biosynthesis